MTDPYCDACGTTITYQTGVDYFDQLGAHYGYPTCCRSAFARRFTDYLAGRRAPKPIKLPDSGFIPCLEHERWDDTRLIELINSRRECPIPFEAVEPVKGQPMTQPEDNYPKEMDPMSIISLANPELEMQYLDDRIGYDSQILRQQLIGVAQIAHTLAETLAEILNAQAQFGYRFRYDPLFDERHTSDTVLTSIMINEETELAC